jgi:hypothetical protein
MSLVGDCHEVEVTPNLELLVTFGMSLEGACQELYTYFHYKLTPNLEMTKKFLERSSRLIRYEKITSLKLGWSLTKNLPTEYQCEKPGVKSLFPIHMFRA